MDLPVLVHESYAFILFAHFASFAPFIAGAMEILTGIHLVGCLSLFFILNGLNYITVLVAMPKWIGASQLMMRIQLASDGTVTLGPRRTIC